MALSSRPLHLRLSGVAPETTVGSNILFTVPAERTVILRSYVLAAHSTGTDLDAAVQARCSGVRATLTKVVLPVGAILERPGTYVVLGPGDQLSVFVNGATPTTPKRFGFAAFGTILFGAPDATPLV